MPILQEFVAWFAKFVAVSVTLLIAVYLYGRKQRLKAKQAAEQAEKAEQQKRSGGMQSARKKSGRD